ncbi:hypothetical protein ACHAW6_006260 [Cyclotella cf. meneghiniana]
MQALYLPQNLHHKPITMNVSTQTNSLIFIMLQWGIQLSPPGRNGLTSEGVRCFIKPLEQNLMGHLDQRLQGIRSTKSSSATTNPDPPDPMGEP